MERGKTWYIPSIRSITIKFGFLLRIVRSTCASTVIYSVSGVYFFFILYPLYLWILLWNFGKRKKKEGVTAGYYFVLQCFKDIPSLGLVVTSGCCNYALNLPQFCWESNKLQSLYIMSLQPLQSLSLKKKKTKKKNQKLK